MRILHCTISTPAPILWLLTIATRKQAMSFLIDFATRSRRNNDSAYREAYSMLQGMSASDRADIGIKQADFVRIAREMSRR